jgi:hypothetical protein
MIDKLKLEQILVTNWAKFIDPRQMLSMVSGFASKAYCKETKVERISLTRFELTKDGFIVWADFQAGNKPGTTEFILSSNGSVRHIKTI